MNGDKKDELNTSMLDPNGIGKLQNTAQINSNSNEPSPRELHSYFNKQTKLSNLV